MPVYPIIIFLLLIVFDKLLERAQPKMCGISGFQVNCSLGNQKQNIRKITEKIFHRGPDSRAYWCSEKENVF